MLAWSFSLALSEALKDAAAEAHLTIFWWACSSTPVSTAQFVMELLHKLCNAEEMYC